jgi:hypothetical protein
MTGMPPMSFCASGSLATYRIGAQVRIPAGWRDRLEGTAITEGPPEAE